MARTAAAALPVASAGIDESLPCRNPAIAANEADRIERQVKAHNRRDIDAFHSCYAAHTVIEDATGTVVMRGQEAMRATYSELVRASPDLRAEIATRICIGDYVIDEEHTTGRP